MVRPISAFGWSKALPFSKILVALDGSLTAEAAIALLPSFVNGGPQDEIVLVTVVETDAEADIEAARSYLERTGVEIEHGWCQGSGPTPLVHAHAVGVSLSDPGRPPSKRRVAGRIVELAERSGADLVVLTSNGWSGPDRWLLGSVAERVMQETPTSVLLVRAYDRSPALVGAPERSILVPLDGSEVAEQALLYAYAIAARSRSAAVRLVHVRLPQEGAASPIMRPIYDFRPFPMGDETEYLAGLAKKMSTKRVRTDTVIRDGDPGLQLSEEARERGAQLIVMVSHGRTAAEFSPHGKVTDDVLHGSPVPVLMVRASR